MVTPMMLRDAAMVDEMIERRTGKRWKWDGWNG